MCDQAFSCKSNLNSHIRKQHQSNGTPKDFYCHCGEVSEKQIIKIFFFYHYHIAFNFFIGISLIKKACMAQGNS